MPPIVSPVAASNVLTAGVRPEFINAYERKTQNVRARLSGAMDFAVPSDKAQEIYAYFESPPHARIWPRGQERSRGAFKDVQFTVVNRDWTVGVAYHENDEQDDQTSSLLKQARSAGDNAVLIDERVFFQIVTATADADLLPAVPTAPDGVALASATDGDGNDRYGVSGGNIVTGTGIATAAAIRSDFMNATELFLRFLDTQGQPLFDESLDAAGYVLFYNIQNRQIVNEAFVQARTVQVIENQAGSENVAAAAVTNIILDSGMKVRLVGTPRITDNDMHVFAEGAPYRPVFQQSRSGMREVVGDMSNSDRARDTKLITMDWDWRAGYGVGPAYGYVKINNA